MNDSKASLSQPRNARCPDCGAMLPAGANACSTCNATTSFDRKRLSGFGISSAVGLLLVAAVLGATGTALTVWSALFGGISPVVSLVLKGVAALLAIAALLLACLGSFKKR